MSAMPRRLVLAGVGGDAHSVGLTLLRRGLDRAGYDVDFLGTQNSVDDVCVAAQAADAVLVSNMDGHAEYYLDELAAAQADHGVRDRLWYLGGNPALTDEGATEALLGLGFDRVHLGFVELAAVVADLDRDLAARPAAGRRPPVARVVAPPPTPGAWAGVVGEREEVLAGWHTGAQARVLADNATRLAATASLAAAQRAAEHDDRLLVQPRTGVADLAGQRRLFTTMRDAGADVLSFQVDSMTRNNDYARVEQVLKGRDPDDLLGALNGFPAVNAGVEALARIAEEFRATPLQVRHSTRDPRLLAEITYAAGISAYEGGALSYNLPYYKDYHPAASIPRWRYVDELTGLYAREHGVIIDREFFGVLTACLVPPSIAIVVNVFEALMAAAGGVRAVSVGYAEQGHRTQDLAAVRVLRAQTLEYLAAAGHTDVGVGVVWHQYMGAFPVDQRKARQLLAGSAHSAGRSAANRLMLKTWVEALRVPSEEENRGSLRLVRDVADRARAGRADEPVGAAQLAEEELITAEVRAIVGHALDAAGGDSFTATSIAVERGWIDIPFSPSRWNAGLTLPVRDAEGAVRLASTGALPWPADVLDEHARRVATRTARSHRSVEELVERDIVMITRGEFDQWPLG